jgi:hypothetical protein
LIIIYVVVRFCSERNIEIYSITNTSYTIILITAGTGLEIFNLSVEQFKVCSVEVYALEWFPGTKPRKRKDGRYKN